MSEKYVSSEEIALECLEFCKDELKFLKKRDVVCKMVFPLSIGGAIVFGIFQKPEMAFVSGLVSSAIAVDIVSMHFEKKDIKKEIEDLKKRIDKFEKSNETRQKVVEYYKHKQQTEKEK